MKLSRYPVEALLEKNAKARRKLAAASRDASKQTMPDMRHRKKVAKDWKPRNAEAKCCDFDTFELSGQ